MAATGPTSAAQRMPESLYRWDIATFFRCPVERYPRNCDFESVSLVADGLRG